MGASTALNLWLSFCNQRIAPGWLALPCNQEARGSNWASSLTWSICTSYQMCFQKWLSMTGSYFFKTCFVVFPRLSSLNPFFRWGKRCNQGQYQSLEGQKQCIFCPNDTTTLGFSSADLSDAGRSGSWSFFVFFFHGEIGGTLENGRALYTSHSPQI